MLSEAQQRDVFAAKRIAHMSQDERTTRGGKELMWRLDEEEMLRYKGRLYIPPEESIRQELIRSNHDHPLAGHFGAARTHELLSRLYHWPSCEADVKSYVKTCAVCQKSKAPRHLPYGQLSSLPIPSRPFEELTMDSITGLPPAKRDNSVYDAILVIADRYSKMSRYLPARKDWSAVDLADEFIRLIVCSHWGVPKGIVSDRGPTFTSAFWGEICFQLQVKRRLSSAFHPQTDGQTERQNQTLEHYLRCFCTKHADDWLRTLPMAEFAYNNTVHSSTSQSPFCVVQGQNPRMPDMPDVPEDDHPGAMIPAATARIERTKAARVSLEKHMVAAQQYQQRYYNRHHTAASFKKGTMMLLSTRNLRLTQPSKKLMRKYVGLFKVREVVGAQAYRLWLPTAYRIHDMFHISLLKPYYHREGEPENDAEPPEILSDGEELWEVENLLSHRTRKGRKEYLLRWKGFSDQYDSWAIPSDFENMNEVIDTYEKRARHAVRRSKT